MLDDYTDTINQDCYTGYYTMDGGVYHRTSGPARVWHKDHPDHPGRQEWYLFGELIPVSSQKEFESFLKLKAFW